MRLNETDLRAQSGRVVRIHNTIIFSRCKNTEERAYYLNLCRTEHYTSRELERQIDAAQLERNAIGQPKLSATLRELHPNIQYAFKDNYVLEFLGLPKTHSESDLQKGMRTTLPLCALRSVSFKRINHIRCQR